MARPPKTRLTATCSTAPHGAARPQTGAPKGRAGRRRLYGARHRGAGRARAGAAAARHVYRRHRREGAAPPVRRSDRQRDGRGARRPRRLDRRQLSADGFVTVADNGRGIPVDPHPEVPEKIRARSHHVHAARGRQIQLQGLRHLGRPAWRRRLGHERALRAHGGRGRARRQALRDGVRARHPAGQAEGNGPHAEPARHLGALQARPENLWAKAAFKPARLFKMSRSKAYLFGGVEIRWSCDKALLARRRCAGAGDVPFRAPADRLPHRGAARHPLSIPTSSPARSARPAATARWIGRSPGSPTPTASSPPTATRSRRLTAAPTRRACARR